MKLSSKRTFASCSRVLAILLLVSFASTASAQRLLYQIKGTVTDEKLGHFVQMLGDVNSDGLSDLLIQGAAPSNKNRILVHSGLDGAKLLEIGPESYQSAAAIGDVNLDGHADFAVSTLVSSRVHSGKDGSVLYPLTGGDDPCNCSSFYCFYDFGAAVGSAGDVNQDGHPDIIVGAPSGSWHGYAKVFSGLDGSTLALYKLCDTTYYNAHYYGAGVGTAGDVNQDGYADPVIGNPIADLDNDFFCDGACEVRSGRTGLVLFKFQEKGPTFGCPETGKRLGPLGDLNGDGRSDFWYFGFPYDPGSKIRSGNGTQMHGSITLNAVSITSIQDLDLDGKDDFVLSDDQALVRAYSGSSGLLLFELTGFAGDSNNPKLKDGVVVAGGGDLNGDGIPDLVVGDAGFDLDASTPNAGVVNVYSLCVPAGWNNYGSGFPGTLGIPSIGLSADPELGATVQLLVGN